MNDDLDLERRIRERLRSADLPEAPAGLRVRLANLRERPVTVRRRRSMSWWAALVPAGAILVLALSGVFGGALAPSASQSPTTSAAPVGSTNPTLSIASTVHLTLVTLGSCGSEGGCVGYVSLVPDGATGAPEIRVSQLGERRVTEGLPNTIEPGRYVIRAHTAFLSDVVVNGEPPAETDGPSCSASMDAAAGTAIVVSVWFGSDACTAVIASTVLAPHGLAGLPPAVNGLPVMSVTEVLAARAAGGLVNQPVAVGGYWSNGSVRHSCVPPPEPTGELELWCSDGEFGITDLDERILTVDHRGYGTEAVGPHLTPWFPDDLDGLAELFGLPVINGQQYPPVPIVVVGHFNDPRAEDCRPAARQLCRDRLVVDRIAVFDTGAVPTPGVTPSPTPFPSPAPTGLFGPELCAGDVPYSFVGWTTTADLQLPFEREGHVWAMVTVDPVLLSGSADWFDDPNGSGHRYRPWGRWICIGQEGIGGVEFGVVPGSAYWEWDDGRRTPSEP
jgi:hypothetical protein